VDELSPIVRQAMASAAGWHFWQKRKYTGEPYFNHCHAVAELVRSVPHDEAMICAAYMHDLVEDTEVSYQNLLDWYGHDIAGLVMQLTDVSTKLDGNRKQRKALDREHIAKASPRAKTIKLADLIDNSHSIIERDPEFAKVYIEEKRLLLEVLTEGDPTLYARAREIVDRHTSKG
jgi:(p)ppGpp synthase/HD superfamily hydrolase